MVSFGVRLTTTVHYFPLMERVSALPLKYTLSILTTAFTSPVTYTVVLPCIPPPTCIFPVLCCFSAGLVSDNVAPYTLLGNTFRNEQLIVLTG